MELDIRVPILTELVEGLEVVVAKGTSSKSPCFGLPNESKGRILGFDPNVASKDPGDIVVVVEFSRGSRCVTTTNNVVAYQDYLAYEASSPNNLRKKIPKYKEDQVLYLKPSPTRHPSGEYPSVGSNYESDVKVIAVNVSFFGNHVTYQIYIPHYGSINVEEDVLITAEERFKYLHSDFKEATVSKDLLPFFVLGERVRVFEGFVYTMDQSRATVKLTPDLQAILKFD